MTGRIIAIGDIHGCSIALNSLLKAIDLQSNDTVVTLGDYVDRGSDSKGVLDQLIDLSGKCQLVSILGNHDEMMLHAKEGRTEFDFWMNRGGEAALDSYGPMSKLDPIPAAHFRFLEQCVAYFETETHFFLHANYKPDLPLDQQDIDTIRWLSLRDFIPAPHCSGKTAVLGHTPQPEVLDLGYLICLDTGCSNGGWLTAMDVATHQLWQVDISGNPRSSQ